MLSAPRGQGVSRDTPHTPARRGVSPPGPPSRLLAAGPIPARLSGPRPEDPLRGSGSLLPRSARSGVSLRALPECRRALAVTAILCSLTNFPRYTTSPPNKRTRPSQRRSSGTVTRINIRHTEPRGRAGNGPSPITEGRTAEPKAISQRKISRRYPLQGTRPVWGHL